MKKMLGSLLLVAIGITMFHGNPSAGVNLWELRDANNVKQVSIDHEKNIKDAKLESLNLRPGKFVKGVWTFQNPITVDGLMVYGATNTATLKTVACKARGCAALNTDDFDWYTSTGVSYGNWRNSRTGSWLPETVDPVVVACNNLDYCLGFDVGPEGTILSDALNLCNGGADGCDGDVPFCTASANTCCVGEGGACQ